MRRSEWNWRKHPDRKHDDHRCRQDMKLRMSENSQIPTVLVLGASPRISLSIARSLQRRNIRVEVATFQPEEPNLHSGAVGQFHRLPGRQKNDEGLRKALIALLREKQFDLILPAGDPALAAIAEYYDDLTPLVRVGTPVPSVVERVLNKSLTLETAQQCGIQVPFTCTVNSQDELESAASRLPFPIVVKPGKKGAAAFRALYAKNLLELRTLLKRNKWESVLLQEFCPGVGVGVEILMHEGRCVAQFQHRRLKEAPVTGGVAILAIAEESDPALLQNSVTLLRALQWEGPAMVEYRVDPKTGKSVLMEVNGRFWGSVSFPISAGIDFPLYYWQLLHGEIPSVPNGYQAGKRWRWTPGYIDRIYSVISRSSGSLYAKPSLTRELFSSVGDLSPFIKEALWSWSDPVPFFAELGRMLWGFVGTFFKAGMRKLASRKVQSYVGIYARLEPQARSRYVEFRMKAVFGMTRNGHGSGPPAENVRSVLFVCYGNLMRSPMAEAMLRHELLKLGVGDVSVRSAGVHAVRGRQAHMWAQAVSRELGMPLDAHRAQPTTSNLIASSDLILAMDYENLAELETRYPEGRGRIFLLSRYADGPLCNREIPDPYFGDIETTRRCYAVLGGCIEKLAQELNLSRSRKEVPLAH